MERKSAIDATRIKVRTDDGSRGILKNHLHATDGLHIECYGRHMTIEKR